MNTFKLTQTGPETQDILDQVNGNTEDIEQLKDLYQAFVGSGITIVESSDWPISNPQEKVIYRVTGESSYSDYMWNGTHFIEMATYDNAIDDEPTEGSNNLVKSGGVYEFVVKKVIYDISDANSGASYASLSSALGANGVNVPSSVRNGGMSVKFINSGTNKYEKWIYTLNSISDADIANVENWIGVDVKPTSNSKNLVESGGVKEYVDEKTTDVVEYESVEGSDLELNDGDGGTLVQFREGHIKTKNFDSSQIGKDVSFEPDDEDLELADNDGGVLAKFANGHIQTKNFNSATLLAQVTAAMEGKVDKVEGKGLSENDLTDALLAQIEATIANEGKPAVITIAASNASDIAKNNANFVCSGSNDQLVINQVIAAVPEGIGAEIHLTGGTFNISAPIMMDKDKMTLSGEGYGVFSEGTTLIKCTEYCHGIIVGKVVEAAADPQKIRVHLKNFLINGRYNAQWGASIVGTDTAGIYIRQGLDASSFESIGVLYFRVGFYLIEPARLADNVYSDLTTIFNLSIQFCGCAMIVNSGMVMDISACCLSEGIGIGTFNDDGRQYDCAGLYMGGSRNCIHDNFFVTCDNQNQLVRNPPQGYVFDNVYSVCLAKNHNLFHHNFIERLRGGGIYVTGINNMIDGNTIFDYGGDKVTGYRTGIKFGGNAVNMTYVHDNRIGRNTGSATSEDTIAKIGIGGSAGKYVTIKNNVFYNVETLVEGTIPSSTEHVIEGSVEWNYPDKPWNF